MKSDEFYSADEFSADELSEVIFNNNVIYHAKNRKIHSKML